MMHWKTWVAVISTLSVTTGAIVIAQPKAEIGTVGHAFVTSHSTNSASKYEATVSRKHTLAQTDLKRQAQAEATSLKIAVLSGVLPPGVTYDATVQPLASQGATYEQKFSAVLQIAESKLGTPYIWGHNEDRGEHGFDCSNFTAYVYHHALGYKMSGASQVQYQSVGWPVQSHRRRKTDVLITHCMLVHAFANTSLDWHWREWPA